jgi:hypothetical protein
MGILDKIGKVGSISGHEENAWKYMGMLDKVRKYVKG